MKLWLLYSLLCLFFWGIWAIFGKLASRTLSYFNVLLLALFGYIFAFIIYLSFFYQKLDFKFTSVNHFFAFCTGIVGCIGVTLFYAALSRGEASRIVLITALYPIVTITFSIFLFNEHFTLSKLFGVIFALLGIFLLSK